MKRRSPFNISLFILLGNVLAACFTPQAFSKPNNWLPEAETKSLKPVASPKVEPKKEPHHRMVSVDIDIENASGAIKLGADVYRPDKGMEPKTLVILVPGSGNISRKGETNGDGISTYSEPVEQNTLWAQSLADAGIFVLAYDKRTCTKASNPLCNENPQTDIKNDGISALSKDLDGVFHFAISRFMSDDGGVKVVLMSSTQGAQVITHSASAKMSSGLILLSPIVGDMAESWTSGLKKAHDLEKISGRKTTLLNQSESTKSFFASLRAGRFSGSANVRGASVAFWESWIKASSDTMPKAIDLNVGVLMVFNKGDLFSSPALIENITFLARKQPKIQIKTLSGGDRNFIENKALTDNAFNSVMEFIKKAPITRSFAPLP